MSTFWIAVALMLAGALAWLLRPLLRRQAVGAASDSDAANVAVYRAQLAELDAERDSGGLDAARYEQAKRELMQRLALDVEPRREDASKHVAPSAAPRSIAAALALAVALPLAAVLLYRNLGNPAALALGPKDAALQREVAQMTPERIDEMVRKLEAYLKNKPDDAKGWGVLARTYRGLGKLPQANAAFERALALAPNDIDNKIEFAETLGYAANGDLRGRPTQLIAEAMQLDPNHQSVLALAGSAAAQRGDTAEAVRVWEKLLALLPADAEVRPALAQRINELRGQSTAATPNGANPSATPSPNATNAAVATANGAAKIDVKVSLAPALAAQVGTQDTLFVFARAAQGPKMPLAVVRAKPSELPRAYTLSDANAMTPEMALSKFDQVVVGARVSKSGTPAARSGDLEGLSAAVKPGAGEVEVIIDRVVP